MSLAALSMLLAMITHKPTIVMCNKGDVLPDGISASISASISSSSISSSSSSRVKLKYNASVNAWQ